MSGGVEWKGRIVVRFLGKEIEKDYDQKRKPKTKLDPSSLVEGSGALIYRPIEPIINDESSSGLEKNIKDTEDSTSSVRLDAYIFRPPSSSGDHTTSAQPTVVNLSRQYGEAVDNCLNRLGLSIARKFKSGKNKGIKEKKSHKNARTPAANCVALFEGKSEPVNISGMSNLEFWSLGMRCPICIEVLLNDRKISLQVEVNPPTLLSISTFEKFGGELFPEVPILVEVETLFASGVKVDWYADGQLVSSDSPVYVPTTKNAGKDLAVLVTPVRSGYTSDSCHTEAYQFQEKVAPTRPENTVISIRQEWQSPRQPNTLRVMSFNILADQNAFSGPNHRDSFFPWVGEEILKRSRRMPLILHEILVYQADIVCLQEVDQIIFDTLLRPVLGHYRYQGFYSVKQTAGNQEGCAMFWSLDTFQESREEDYQTIALRELLKRYETPLEEDDDWKHCAGVITEIFRKRPDLQKTVTTKLGHVVQIAHLRGLDGAPLLVSNTHLFFHPIAPHIRLMQLFAIAHQLSLEQGSLSKPLVFCGDLNTSLKNCAALLMNRCVPKNHRDYRECFNSFDWESDKGRNENSSFDDDFPGMRLPDSFPELATAYPVYPDFTHYIVGFSAALDHILMTPKTACGELRSLKQAEMPTLEQVTRDQAMPSPSFPSDHISVVADLEWIPTNIK